MVQMVGERSSMCCQWEMRSTCMCTSLALLGAPGVLASVGNGQHYLVSPAGGAVMGNI